MMCNQAEKDYRSETAANDVDLKRKDRHLSSALDAANDKRFLQNPRVRTFHTALAKEEIRNYNAVMAASKRETERKANQQKREEDEKRRQICINAQRKEQENIRQRRRDNVALEKERVKQIKEKKLLKEEERRQEKEERDQLRALDEQHKLKLRDEHRKEQEAKDKNIKLRKEEIYRKNVLRQREIEKLNMKEKETKRVQTDREELLQKRKQEKSEQLKMRQIPKDIVNDQLAEVKKRQAAQRIQIEEVKLLKEVAEADAKVRKQQKDVKEKRAAALKSIAAHREETHCRKQQKEREEKQSSLDLLHQMKQHDRLSEEQSKRDAYLKRQTNIKHQEDLLSDDAKNKALRQQKIKEELHAAREMEKQIAEGENQIQQYMQQKSAHHPAAQRLLKVSDYNYFCRETGECLPKRGTDPFRREFLMKRHQERSSLQQAPVDVRPHVQPTLSRASDARHGSKDAGEPLPTKANSTCQCTASSEEKIKQYLEKDKFQVKESSTADLRPTRTPTIKTPGAPAGRHSAPTGVQSSKNRGKETGERSPRLDTSKSRDTKQENSVTSLRRTLVAPPQKKNSETSLQRTLVAPPQKKNSETSLRRTLVAPPQKKNNETNLRRTLVAPPQKKNNETSLRRTLVAPPQKKNSENSLRRTLVAPLTIAHSPAVKIRSTRMGPHIHSTMRGEPLLRYSTPQTQMIKRKQESSMMLN
ncbi:hypothetical protein CesoFtcFv8_012230 [Champsocephalus esox]|uniref:Trichohyalin-like n=2 Tax=Champsocephalus esox TaxID=159716 RepID=A0AAN8BUL9_9TELE|nr:hypothetical protein CesoFtcFv8_012230 [Champsocephalus esox]